MNDMDLVRFTYSPAGQEIVNFTKTPKGQKMLAAFNLTANQLLEECAKEEADKAPTPFSGHFIDSPKGQKVLRAFSMTREQFMTAAAEGTHGH